MKHKLQILSLGHTPAATCACGKWGFVMTTLPKDDEKTKRQKLQGEYTLHVVAETKTKKGK